MEEISKRKLEECMFKQMTIQHSSYPSRIHEVDISNGLDPIEFSQMINDNFPVLMKNGPFNLLDFSSLRNLIGNVECPVAQTPFGNADAPLHNKLFVKSHIEQMKVNDLLTNLEQKREPVCYMQSQDDNLSKEFKPLIDHIDKIPWADKVLGEPEAVNLWIGDDRTTSRLHNDNYENLFLQLNGEKTIYLIPPGDCYCLDERFLYDATYIKKSGDDDNNNKFQVQIDGTDVLLPYNCTSEDIEEYTDASKTLFPTVNPASKTINQPHIYTQHCKVYKVVLKPGDMLYIPALWYHQVVITASPCISINHWYPSSTMRPLWAHWDYLRASSLILRGYHDPLFFDDDI